MSWQYLKYVVRTAVSVIRSGVMLGPVIVLAGATSPQIVGEKLPPAAPQLDQSVTLEFGDAPHPTSVTLCETTHPVVVFDEPLEEQVYQVMEAYPMGLTDDLKRLTAKAIVQESRANGLDPWMVVGLIRVESSFWNYSVSNKDAIGLMQLLPYVGHTVASDIGVQWNGPETLFHPVKNVKLGTAYLARLHRRFDGDDERALQAYNVGPTRLSRWVRQGRELPTEYSGAVKSFWVGYADVSDVPADEIRTLVSRAEGRYRDWKQARVVAALEATEVQVAPADLADALNAGVESVDATASEEELLETATIPRAPAELEGQMGHPGSAGELLAPPLDPELEAVLAPVE